MFKYIACFLLFVLVVSSLYTFVMTDIMKKDYVNIFGYTYFIIDTDSMLGTFDINDVVFVKLDNDVQINDIVSYKKNDGKIVTHRLVDRIGNKLITKGDDNSSVDQPITKNMVIGSVRSSLSLKFMFKCITLFLITFIFLVLINFEKIIKKFVLKNQVVETGVVDSQLSNNLTRDEKNNDVEVLDLDDELI